ncbi:hypothetical protein GCM10023194_56180 [Planotetraspora phitsanulokensis]|uniref:N-acetylmuramoyl-L-alanine amidase n=1 Tax=Planotetraspora phitsanulokensis TaxID=575192 RepID=A0A8J3XJR8_9ACTN|nr:peptidoglycan recognition family protein [Planotetraspora phitsanulokensis]GII42336.1 hypothetical protein Pph01_73390 [Planotetraspora phitsanulokensis]
MPAFSQSGPRLRETPVTRRAFLLAGTGLAGGLLLGASAQAFSGGPARPRIYTRSEWHAAPPKTKAVILNRTPDRLVIHHTATPNTSDQSLDAAFRLSRAIQRYHMHHNDWADIGEQFTVGRGGQIMEGRNRTLPAIEERKHVMGAQVADHNRHTLGIETEGTYTDDLPTEAQLASLTSLLAWLCGVYELDPAKAIIGHRDLNATSCPGDRLYAHLPQLREDVARRLGGRARSDDARLALPDPAVPDPALLAAPGLIIEGQAHLQRPLRAYDHGPGLGPHDHPWTGPRPS